MNEKRQLFVDLDETIIHSIDTYRIKAGIVDISSHANRFFEIKFSPQKSYTTALKENSLEFLAEARKRYKVLMLTNAGSLYATRMNTEFGLGFRGDELFSDCTTKAGFVPLKLVKNINVLFDNIPTYDNLTSRKLRWLGNLSNKNGFVLADDFSLPKTLNKKFNVGETISKIEAEFNRLEK